VDGSGHEPQIPTSVLKPGPETFPEHDLERGIVSPVLGKQADLRFQDSQPSTIQVDQVVMDSHIAHERVIGSVAFIDACPFSLGREYIGLEALEVDAIENLTVDLIQFLGELVFFGWRKGIGIDALGKRWFFHGE